MMRLPTLLWAAVAVAGAVQLVGRDHAPLRPAAKDRVAVEVG